MHCTAFEQQILRQLIDDDIQWDMIKEIKARGIDGALDVAEVDGVPLTAVEAKMLTECTHDARGWLMMAAATQGRPCNVVDLGQCPAGTVARNEALRLEDRSVTGVLHLEELKKAATIEPLTLIAAVTSRHASRPWRAIKCIAGTRRVTAV